MRKSIFSAIVAFILTTAISFAVPGSATDMPQFAGWPAGTLDSGAGIRVMAYQCGPYCWKTFNPDSIKNYVARKLLGAVPSEGAFLMTGRGFGTDPSDSARWTLTGKDVTLQIPLLSATSDSAGFLLSGMGTTIRPARAQVVPVCGVFIGAAADSSRVSTVSIATTGLISVTARTAGGAPVTTYPTSGTKGIGACTIKYSLK